MGRHSDAPQGGDEGAAEGRDVVLWTAFAVLVATVVVGTAGPGWREAAAVGALGAVVAGVLALLVRLPPPRVEDARDPDPPA